MGARIVARTGLMLRGQALACGALATMLAVGGCASYRVGADTLYRPDIQTVAVPIFQSESLRRTLGERLTEAVGKEIENKTPYRLADGLRADSYLIGRLVGDSKYPITENINDELRDLELELFVEVAWRDRYGNDIYAPHVLPIPQALTTFGQAVHFVPEGGQSLATAQQEAIEKLAEQIVARMERPW